MRPLLRHILVLSIVEVALWLVHWVLASRFAGSPLAAAMLTGTVDAALIGGAVLVLVRVTAIVLFPMFACASVVHRLVDVHR